MYQTNKLLEIKLLVDPNIIKETLSRIGIVDKKNKIIYQSCHLLKQFDTYYLVHFKQLFTLLKKHPESGLKKLAFLCVTYCHTIAYKHAKIQISARFYNQKTAIIYNREQILNKQLFL